MPERVIRQRAAVGDGTALGYLAQWYVVVMGEALVWLSLSGVVQRIILGAVQNAGASLIRLGGQPGPALSQTPGLSRLRDRWQTLESGRW